EDNGDGTTHGIWIHDEGDVPQSRSELEAFKVDPDQSKYVDAGREANAIRKAERQEHEQRRKNIHDMRGKFRSPLGGSANITKGVIAICAVITGIGLLTGQTDGDLGRQVYDALAFLNPTHTVTYRNTGDPLVSITKGEVWRLLTPVF